jgi:hypothetical protein
VSLVSVRSSRWPSTVTMSRSRLSVMRPELVEIEQVKDCRKCDPGKVCCHQQVGAKSLRSCAESALGFVCVPIVGIGQSAPQAGMAS